MSFIVASSAYGYDENKPYPYMPSHAEGDCNNCHTNGCDSCHALHLPGTDDYRGPHGLYSSATAKCEVCHTVHDAGGTLKLLPGNTINDTCLTCHDGTAGNGVYGALVARGLTVGGGHSIDSTNAVPGGDAATGGSSTRVFKGEGGFLTCTDCHSPHETDTVAAFFGDRRRSTRPYPMSRSEVTNSTKLLKQKPTGATTSVLEYGSDWCLACHAGRASGDAVHNHPVETASSTANPYVYRNLPVVNADTPTSVTVLGQLGGRPAIRGSGNRGYLMPYPRTVQQAGHAPICMQCHEDTRDVGDLDAAGVADAVPSVVTTLDGRNAADNPRFQNFPHETENAYMVIENDDDLCLNCHPTGGLP